MSRYGYKPQLDPRVNVYHDDDMDFSRGSYGARPRAVAIVEPSEYSLNPSHQQPSSPHVSAPTSQVHDHPRQEYEEDKYDTYASDGGVAPPPPVSAYLPWTGGVQYSDPKHAIVQPISNEELLDGLSDMRLQREKRNAELGFAPRGPSNPGFGQDNGYGNRAGAGPRPSDQGYGNRGGGQSGGMNVDPWGNTGGDDNWGGGGGGGQSRGNDCFNCGQPGHRSAECTQERNPRGGGGGGGGECFNCGELGHRSAECTQERKPRGSGGSGGACFKCGEDGHFSRECVNAPTSGGRACYNCGEPGHESRDCQNDRVVGAFRGECYNCGEQGHSSRDCPNERKPGAFRGACHNCGEDGHQSRDCGQPRNSGGRYAEADSGRGPTGFPDRGDPWGAPADTPQTPGFVRSSENDGGWGESPQEQIITPAGPPIERGRTMGRDGWNSHAPAVTHFDKPPPSRAQASDDGWGQSSAPVQQSCPVKQAPAASPAGPGPGIHPDRLRMLNQQGAGTTSHQSRQDPIRDRPPHMEVGGYGAGSRGGYAGGMVPEGRGGYAAGGGGGYEDRGGYGSRSSSAQIHAPPPPLQQQQQQMAPPAPQPVANDEYDGW